MEQQSWVGLAAASNAMLVGLQLMVHLQWCQQWLSIAHHSQLQNCLCMAYARRVGGGGGGGKVWGGNSVWQMGEYVFLWHLPSPSHLNQSFCNLHDLWIEFSSCLERPLLKRRTTVTLSDLASWTYVRVKPINFESNLIAANMTSFMHLFQN